MGERVLREDDVDADPMVQVARWVDEARDASVLDWDAMVVATATADGAPSARVVLLRGLDHRGLRFYTSFVSRKGRELTDNPRAAAVLHWRELGRQVRVVGSVTRLSPDESVRYWDARPLGSRWSAWASRQSEVVASRADLEAAVAEVRARFGDADPPLPPFWGGFLLEPGEVELWQHREDRLHDRLRYRPEPGGGWVLERLQP